LCRNIKKKSIKKGNFNYNQKVPQNTISDLTSNNYQINHNNDILNNHYRISVNDIENNFTKEKNQKRNSKFLEENINNYFNPQKKKHFNFFEQDMHQRNIHRRNLSNDGLINNISSRDYSQPNINNNIYFERENCNQSFTDYNCTNNINNYNCTNNVNNYNLNENSKNICNDSDNNFFYNICSNDLISSDKYYIDNNHKNYTDMIIKNNINNNLKKTLDYSKEDRIKNSNYIGYLIGDKFPYKEKENESPEKRIIIDNSKVANKSIFYDNISISKGDFPNKFDKNYKYNLKNENSNYFKKFNKNYNYNFENENSQTNSNYVNNSSQNVEENLEIADMNKKRNQENIISYRPSTIIFQRGKHSKSMDITNRNESYFLGDDNIEDKNNLSLFDKNYNIFRNQNEDCSINYENNRKNENNQNFLNEKKKVNIPINLNKFGSKSNQYSFNDETNKKNVKGIDVYYRRNTCYKNFDSELKNDINIFNYKKKFHYPNKKRSHSTRIKNSNYSKRQRKNSNSNSFKNNSNLSNGIKNSLARQNNSIDEFYYNLDLDEFDKDKYDNIDKNKTYKINSLKNFETSENCFKNTQYKMSSANNYNNNYFLNTNFNVETENTFMRNEMFNYDYKNNYNYLHENVGNKVNFNCKNLSDISKRTNNNNSIKRNTNILFSSEKNLTNPQYEKKYENEKQYEYFNYSKLKDNNQRSRSFENTISQIRKNSNDFLNYNYLNRYQDQFSNEKFDNIYNFNNKNHFSNLKHTFNKINLENFELNGIRNRFKENPVRKMSVKFNTSVKKPLKKKLNFNK